jgi:hypothetical protein
VRPRSSTIRRPLSAFSWQSPGDKTFTLTGPARQWNEVGLRRRRAEATEGEDIMPVLIEASCYAAAQMAGHLACYKRFCESEEQ